MRFVILLAGLFLFSTLYSAENLGPRKNLFTIKKIEIEGLKKVEKEAVLEKLGAKEGMVLDNYLLRSDVQKIYGLKYFESVEAHERPEGVLVFVVKERPIITNIILKGNSGINEDDLLGVIKVKKFTIVDINTIKNDISALQKHYEEKGYYLASVTYELKQVTPESVDLTFKIKEYDKVKVKKIIFLGNNAFSDEQLKDIMETREESVFSFLTGAGNFKEINFQTDVEKLKYFYKTKGYLQVNVGGPEITVTEDKRWVFITIKVNEGPQFAVNEITFQGDMLYTEEELFEKIDMKKGKIYSEEDLRLDIQKLTEMYQDKGYAFANVLRTLSVVPGENKVNVEFSFEKGKIAYFGRIYVKGNTKTRDKVIRRELKILEGEMFSGTNLRLSKENVNRLGFFEPGSIVFNTITPKGKDDVLDVEISVKERNTGQITLGAGYSTATKFFAQASIAQNNFRGLGQNLAFSYYWGQRSTNFTLSFTEPYFLDTLWTAGGELFYTDNKSSEAYEYHTQGFSLRVGYPIFEYTRVFLTYKFEDSKLRNDYDPTIDPDLENGVASSVRPAIVNDRRNNKFEPTAGHYASASLEYAGLGGSKKWLKSEVEGRHYYNVVGDLVFRSRLSVARMDTVGGQKIPRTEKFTLGGARDMRGYNYEKIGPKRWAINKATNVLQEFNQGGLFSVLTTFEFEHPLAREAGLKWVVFMDAGNIFDKYWGENGKTGLLKDYGFGFRWFSPIGILRFEFGYPWGGPYKNEGGQFHFDIGEYF
jgi:outer membrane protein insertion porin family